MKDGMASISFKIVGAFIEVSNSRYVILPVLSQIFSTAHYHTSIPDGFSMKNISFQDWRYDNHIILLAKLQMHTNNEKIKFKIIQEISNS